VPTIGSSSLDGSIGATITATTRSAVPTPPRSRPLTTTKGDRPTVVALAPPTMQAIALAIYGRDRGPLLVNRVDRRMTAYNVQYLVGARS
jgi:hypothetical protein